MKRLFSKFNRSAKGKDRTLPHRERSIFSNQSQEITRESLLPETAFIITRCRTQAKQSLTAPDAGISWLEAIETPDKKWLIKKITERDSFHPHDWQDTGKTNQEEKSRNVASYKKHPVSFINMVHILSEFETGNLGDESFAGPNKEELGDEYFQTALEKEGVIFDNTGLPHGVYNGTIATDGEFPAKAFNVAANFQKTDKPFNNHALLHLGLTSPADANKNDNTSMQIKRAVNNDKFMTERGINLLQKAHEGLLTRRTSSRYEDWKFRYIDEFFKKPKEGDKDTYSKQVGLPIKRATEFIKNISDKELRQDMEQIAHRFSFLALSVITKDAENMFISGSRSVDAKTLKKLDSLLKKAGGKIKTVNSSKNGVNPHIMDSIAHMNENNILDFMESELEKFSELITPKEPVADKALNTRPGVRLFD